MLKSMRFFRRPTKRQRIRSRLRDLGYTTSEIEDIEAAEGDRRYHEKLDDEIGRKNEPEQDTN